MALKYPELHSRIQNLSNKTNITQFGIRSSEIHIREVGKKTKKQLQSSNNKLVILYCILKL